MTCVVRRALAKPSSPLWISPPLRQRIFVLQSIFPAATRYFTVKFAQESIRAPTPVALNGMPTRLMTPKLILFRALKSTTKIDRVLVGRSSYASSHKATAMPSPDCRVTVAFDFQSRQPASCVFVIFAKLVNITGVIILAAGERDLDLKGFGKNSPDGERGRAQTPRRDRGTEHAFRLIEAHGWGIMSSAGAYLTKRNHSPF